MAKYHLNSKGEPGNCRAAKGNCPFGSDDQHFSTKEAARSAYEKEMAAFDAFKISPLGKLDSATDKAIRDFKLSFARAVEWLEDHPKIAATGFTSLGIIGASILANQLAVNYYADTTSVPFTGTILEGHTETKVVGIIGKGGYIDTNAAYTVSGPDGESLRYVTESPTVVPDGTELPLHLYSDGGVHAASVADETAPGTIGATVIGGSLGGIVGFTTAVFAASGLERVSDYVNSKWRLRHDNKFRLAYRSTS